MPVPSPTVRRVRGWARTPSQGRHAGRIRHWPATPARPLTRAADAPVGCGRLGLSPEVLVHGALVDGCGWRAVPDLLTLDGYHLAVVQNPTVSPQGDAAATRLIIDMQ